MARKNTASGGGSHSHRPSTSLRQSNKRHKSSLRSGRLLDRLSGGRVQRTGAKAGAGPALNPAARQRARKE
eukprot:CAMPEP_0194297236 /NCGR_PEP_ID=MMETSP0169-20130528/58361_1 /TAXON_ID=218684 /ORGANISM="Corethron pennatum, Strain L29A3" /LENGTH=70 /DNA_ID=CAMNT_0039046981 /DNA_START=106 /DNA_END=315 /DNA_ORIENTATION=-